MKKLLFSILLIPLLSACTPEPKPIDYGADACEFCRMTIVDKQHAAEVVTQKGRVYKFDAVECMLPYVEERGEEEFALLLVTGYDKPGLFFDAREATYLISQAIPSPMGAFLTAFANEAHAAAVQQDRGGALYEWPELRQHFREKAPLR